MFRGLTALALGLICSINAQAALLTSFNFNTNLSPTTTSPGVTVTGLTPVQARVSQVNNLGVGGTGAAQFASVPNQTYLNSATLTLSGVPSIQVDSLKFDLAKNLGAAGGSLKITNNVNYDVYEVSTNSTTFSSKTITFNPIISTSGSIVFTIARKSDSSNSSALLMDNLEVYGVVPEPASMAVFAGLG
ncbi:MAG: hypothetical protein WCH39_29855, partial [Schlesneria sp.]